MFKHTGDGFPATLKDDRNYGQELTMDQVEQLILRSVCLNGFELGVEVGRRMAEKKFAKAKNVADAATSSMTVDVTVECRQVLDS